MEGRSERLGGTLLQGLQELSSEHFSTSSLTEKDNTTDWPQGTTLNWQAVPHTSWRWLSVPFLWLSGKGKLLCSYDTRGSSDTPEPPLTTVSVGSLVGKVSGSRLHRHMGRKSWRQNINACCSLPSPSNFRYVHCKCYFWKEGKFTCTRKKTVLTNGRVSAIVVSPEFQFLCSFFYK